MKHKFSSMGRVAIALVLALSLCLVMAVPVAANATATHAVSLEAGIGYGIVDTDLGTAEWSTDQHYAGAYSAKLSPGTTSLGLASAKVSYGGTLTAFSNLDETAMVFWTYYDTALKTSFAALWLDIDDDDVADVLLVNKGWSAGTIPLAPNTWCDAHLSTAQAPNTWHVYGYDADTGGITSPVTFGGTSYDSNVWDSLVGWAAKDADAEVLYVGQAIGGVGGSENCFAYADDMTIDGTTYPLEPIFLDASFYQIGGTPTVTVSNGNEAGSGKVQVSLESDLANHSTNIWAYEKSGNPGVFEGSFTLVETLTGVNQLLVIDGDTIKVSYTGDWGTGDDQVLDFDMPPSATVDDTLPVVAITAPSDGDFVAGDSVAIVWTIDETNQDALSVTIGGTEVATGGTTHTWDTTEIGVAPDPEEDLWPDGAYTIEVVATDKVGNVGSDSIDVTVDNTAPVIGDQEATPPVVEPDIENTIVFTSAVTEANIETVTIDLSDAAIGGSTTAPMLDDGVAPDATPADGIYTTDITVTIAVETTYYLPVTATDLAGLSDTTTGDDRLELVVSSDIVPPVITDAAITYLFVGVDSAQPGELVTISANVIDLVGMDTVTAECDVVTDEAAEPTLTTIALLDNGVDPDDEADDGIYTGTATVDETAGWGDYPITITATDAKGNVATDESLILAVRSGATGIEIALVEGWNLISLPLIPDDLSIEAVLGEVTVDIVWGYDPVNSPDDPWAKYVPGLIEDDLTTMEDGVGYWVYMAEADTLTITGREWPVPPAVPPVYSVVEGWNLIGVKSIGTSLLCNLYLGNLYDGELPEFSVIWGYDSAAGRYFNVYPMGDEFLFPTQGYWLWMRTDGTIVPPQ